MARRYVILDVFTKTALAGNPLAVVFDADGLDAPRMQGIAAEFNLSETVFVFPAGNKIHSAAVRIFTPTRELAFAGHPTIGAAFALGRAAAAGNSEMRERVLVLEEEVGPIRCGVSLLGEDAGHVLFDAPKHPVELGQSPGREALAAALGLVPSEVGLENHLPTLFSSGIGFAFVPVRDLAAIAKAKIGPAGWAGVFGGKGLVGVFVYCRETAAAGHHFHARMFAPEAGIVEDAATGSAAVAFAGVIARFDEPPGGTHRYVIEQGFEMDRPSLIELELDMDGGEIEAVRLGGNVVVVGEGMLKV